MSDTTEPRLCKDCRWYWGFNDRERCTFHREFDLVRGSTSVWTSPYRERRAWVLFETGDRCKPEGRNWNQRPPMPPPPPADQD